jgi:DNA helicase-2/ATP-dependent DNA helicase PcrA
MDVLHMAAQLDDTYRTTCTRLGVDEPWFGAFALVRGDKRSHYYVGARRHPDERILDWRHPLAEAYYDGRPGEVFELDAPHPHYADVTGIIAYHAAVQTHRRALHRVEIDVPAGKHVLVATARGFMLVEQHPRVTTPQHGLPDVLALLTPEQYRLITASRGQPLIIQGRAGSGKTTVALYRVAWLTYAPEDGATVRPVEPSKVLIVMFNKALSTFVAQSLRHLRLEGVRLHTFHSWALAAVRRAYRGTITLDLTERPGSTIAVRLKKQVGILRALDEFVAQQTARLDVWLATRLAQHQATVYLDQFRRLDLPVVQRLVAVRREVRRARDAAASPEQARLADVVRVFDRAIRRMTLYKKELWQLLTNRELLARHLAARTEDLRALARYQSALQGANGTGSRIAVEDLALLLRLIELKHGGFPNAQQEDEVTVYDHVVIDEAQDFGAVDLMVLLHAVASRTGVTIVGDINQQIMPDVDFIGWEALAATLGIAGAAVATLEVAHRSTQPIMALADFVARGPATPLTASPSSRPSPRPCLLLVDDTDEAVTEQVATLATGDLAVHPAAHVCVVCATPATAHHLHARLARRLAPAGFPVRHGYRDAFTFAPGLTITNLRQVKGLEFDSVIVVDQAGKPYAATAQGRRNLYTVITRAKDQLRFVARRTPSPLLTSALTRGLLLVEPRDGPPVTVSEDEEEPC